MKKTFTNLFLVIVLLIVILLCGCDGGYTPPLPDNEIDGVNTEVAYVKISPTAEVMKVNQAKKFSVKAYNSNNNPIVTDPSGTEWFVEFQCPGCGRVWRITPTINSLQTTFTPLKAGKYRVCAMYHGKWGCAEVNVQ